MSTKAALSILVLAVFAIANVQADCVSAINFAETTVSDAYSSGDISKMMEAQKAFQSMVKTCSSGSSQCKSDMSSFQTWARGNPQATLSDIVNRLEDLKKSCSTSSTSGRTPKVNTPKDSSSTGCVSSIDTAETTVSDAYSSGDMSKMMEVQKAFQSMVKTCSSGSSQCKIDMSSFQTWARGNPQATLSDIVSRLEDLKNSCSTDSTPTDDTSSNVCVSALDDCENLILQFANSGDFSMVSKIQTTFQTMNQKCASGSSQCRIQLANFATYARANIQADPFSIVNKIEDLKKTCA